MSDKEKEAEEEEERVADFEKERRGQSRRASPPPLKTDDATSKRIADDALESVEAGEKTSHDKKQKQEMFLMLKFMKPLPKFLHQVMI